MTQAEKQRIEEAKRLVAELSPGDAVAAMTGIMGAFTSRFVNVDLVQRCKENAGRDNAVNLVFTLATANAKQRELIAASLAQHAE